MKMKNNKNKSKKNKGKVENKRHNWKKIFLTSLILAVLIYLFFPFKTCYYATDINFTNNCLWTTSALFLFDFSSGDFEWLPFISPSDLVWFLLFSFSAIIFYFIISFLLVWLFYFVKDKIVRKNNYKGVKGR